ncbi:transcriptional regulator [Paenacidovorax caeni]|uniref:transcriptional regulator n=1 Tax=Paenacidovorax caeni TaxID=343013 RepID=UPI0009E7420F|nr:Cro/CI family transcriptional regulator [Paenacidovorax caeni]
MGLTHDGDAFNITIVKNVNSPKRLDAAIENLGGVGKLAAALGVSPSVISNWRARGTTPEAIHCVAIERATAGAVTRCDLRPDDWEKIWPELAAQSKAGEASHG